VALPCREKRLPPPSAGKLEGVSAALTVHAALGMRRGAPPRFFWDADTIATQLSGLLHLAPSQPVTAKPRDERTLLDNDLQDSKPLTLRRARVHVLPVAANVAAKPPEEHVFVNFDTSSHMHALPPEGLVVSDDSSLRRREPIVSRPAAAESHTQGQSGRVRSSPRAEIRRAAAAESHTQGQSGRARSSPRAEIRRPLRPVSDTALCTKVGRPRVTAVVWASVDPSFCDLTRRR
jgi:hypothetical protein